MCRKPTFDWLLHLWSRWHSRWMHIVLSDFDSSSFHSVPQKHGLWMYTRHCAAAGRFPAFQSWWQHSTQTDRGKSICFYNNRGWCNYVTVIQQHRSPDLESFSSTANPSTPPVSLRPSYWFAFTFHRRPMCRRHIASSQTRYCVSSGQTRTS